MKNKNFSFLLIRTMTLMLIVFSFQYTFSQDKGRITGKIFTNDNKAAAFVNVIVENTNKGAFSDENGNYQIHSISEGNHIVTFSLLGLETKSVDVVIREGEVTKIEDIILNVSEEQLQEVVLEVRRKNKFDQKETTYVSRLPLRNIENPQVYSVITGALLEELQVTDMQSTLTQTPGISNVMNGIGSGGVGLNLYLRGFSADIAMRNGIGTAFRAGTDHANIERIEVIKGPSGTLFGTSMVSSYGGVVNLVTKKPYETFGGSAGFSTGSNDLSRLTVDLNTPLNDDNTVLFRLNAAKHSEHSFQDYGLTRNKFIAPALTYKATDKLTLNIEAEFYNTKAPATYFSPAGAGISTMDDLNYSFENSYGSDYLNSENTSFNVIAEAKYKLSDDWTSQTVLSSSSVDNSTHYLFLDFINDSDAARRIMNIESQFTVTQAQQNFTGEFKIGELNNKIVVGIDYYDLRTPYRRTQVVYDTIGSSNPQREFNPEGYKQLIADTGAFRIGQRDQHSISVYASNVLEVTEKLSVMTSLRLDNYNDVENDYSQSYVAPKFGAVYQIVADEISVFANYMNGFKNIAPDFSSGVEVVLNPEYARQIEGGFKFDVLKGKLNATLSYYDIRVNDAVRWENNGGVWSQIQDGTKSSKGLEVEVIANPIKGWNVVFGYANNKSEFIEGNPYIIGKTPAAAPETTINFWTSYKVPEGIVKGLGIGLGANHIGESYVDDSNSLLVPEYTVIDGSIFFDRPTFRIGVKLNNISNKEYWTTMGSYVLPQKTRNTVVSFMYKF